MHLALLRPSFAKLINIVYVHTCLLALVLMDG